MNQPRVTRGSVAPLSAPLPIRSPVPASFQPRMECRRDTCPGNGTAGRAQGLPRPAQTPAAAGVINTSITKHNVAVRLWDRFGREGGVIHVRLGCRREVRCLVKVVIPPG